LRYSDGISYVVRIFNYSFAQDKASMLHLTRAIDRATGYIFVPPHDAPVPEGTLEASSVPASTRPNTFSLFSSAAGSMAGSVGDVQERWIDAREQWDAFERKEWRQEGEKIREAREREKAMQGERRAKGGVRERK
jgi:hypothetical protein